MKKIMFSEIKGLKEEFGFDRFDVEEFINYSIVDEESDFTIGKYRFIDQDFIDEIMAEELGSDEYMLGCFNSWFLADVLDIDQDVIDEMQKCEAFTAIGKLVLSLGKLNELQKAYARADGYGHHFNRYDGSEQELFFKDSKMPSYYVFKE